MQIIRKTEPMYPFIFTEMSFNEIMQNEVLLKNKDLNLTGIYSEINGERRYILSLHNQFISVLMSDTELDTFVKEKNRLRSSKKMKINGKGYNLLSLKQIMYLYKKLKDSFKVEKFRPSGDGELVGMRDVLTLIRNVSAIEEEVSRTRLSDFELLKFIYDKFKIGTGYWFPVNYYGEIGNKIKLQEDSNRTANHPYDRFGLINERYATCEGMAEGLNELFNYFGFKTEVVRNRTHAGVKVYFGDGIDYKVSYIDLAAEISPTWSDSYYEGYERRREPILCTNPNQYRYFLKESCGLGLCDERDKAIRVADEHGNLLVRLNKPIKIINVNNGNNHRPNANSQPTPPKPKITITRVTKPIKIVSVTDLKNQPNNDNNGPYRRK